MTIKILSKFYFIIFTDQWVYKKSGHWYRYLPRRNDISKEFDYDKQMAGPEHFPDKVFSLDVFVKKESCVSSGSQI